LGFGTLLLSAGDFGFWLSSLGLIQFWAALIALFGCPALASYGFGLPLLVVQPWPNTVLGCPYLPSKVHYPASAHPGHFFPAAFPFL
jgi:hypothetical protein